MIWYGFFIQQMKGVDKCVMRIKWLETSQYLGEVGTETTLSEQDELDRLQFCFLVFFSLFFFFVLSLGSISNSLGKLK